MIEDKQDRPILNPQHSWSGSLFLANDRSFYVGAGSDTKVHAKHYVTVVIALYGTFRLVTSRRSYCFRAAIIPPNLPLVFDGAGAQLIVLHFPPEALVSKRFLYPGAEPYSVPAKVWSRFLPRMRSHLDNGCESEEAAGLVHDMINELTSGESPRLDLDPRIANVLECFRAHPAHRFTAAEISSEASLSSSRFAHVFRDQIGVPVRRYLLELRLQHALFQVAQGHSLTASAYEVGFADSAHLSRTFRRMTGMSPSCVLKYSQVSPFRI